jgi:hypothetical protein
VACRLVVDDLEEVDVLELVPPPKPPALGAFHLTASLLSPAPAFRLGLLLLSFRWRSCAILERSLPGCRFSLNRGLIERVGLEDQRRRANRVARPSANEGQWYVRAYSGLLCSKVPQCPLAFPSPHLVVVGEGLAHLCRNFPQLRSDGAEQSLPLPDPANDPESPLPKVSGVAS